MKHVRKVLAALMVMAMAFAFAGCGNKEQTVTYYNKMEESGLVIEHWITFHATGDTVDSIAETSMVDVTGFPEEQRDMLIQVYDVMVESYNAIEGVECTGEYADGIYDLSVSYNTDKATLDAIAELDVAIVEDTEGPISLKATVEAFEAQGYTLSED